MTIRSTTSRGRPSSFGNCDGSVPCATEPALLISQPQTETCHAPTHPAAPTHPNIPTHPAVPDSSRRPGLIPTLRLIPLRHHMAGIRVIPSLARMHDRAEIAARFVKPVEIALGANRTRWSPRDEGVIKWVQHVVQNALRRAGLLGERLVRGEGIYGIRTQKGAPRQRVHWDYSPKGLHSSARRNLYRNPLSAIWAPSDVPFALYTAAGKKVVVPPGCIAVFGSEVAHSGGPHVDDVLRIHSYVVPPGHKIPAAVWARRGD